MGCADPLRHQCLLRGLAHPSSVLGLTENEVVGRVVAGPSDIQSLRIEAGGRGGGSIVVSCILRLDHILLFMLLCTPLWRQPYKGMYTVDAKVTEIDGISFDYVLKFGKPTSIFLFRTTPRHFKENPSF